MYSNQSFSSSNTRKDSNQLACNTNKQPSKYAKKDAMDSKLVSKEIINLKNEISLLLSNAKRLHRLIKLTSDANYVLFEVRDNLRYVKSIIASMNLPSDYQSLKKEFEQQMIKVQNLSIIYDENDSAFVVEKLTLAKLRILYPFMAAIERLEKSRT